MSSLLKNRLFILISCLIQLVYQTFPTITCVVVYENWKDWFSLWKFCFGFEIACAINGAIYTLLAVIAGIPCIYSCFYRRRLRNEFNLNGNSCTDFCTHFCCELCSLCQEYRELKLRGFDMGLGTLKQISAPIHTKKNLLRRCTNSIMLYASMMNEFRMACQYGKSTSTINDDSTTIRKYDEIKQEYLQHGRSTNIITIAARTV